MTLRLYAARRSMDLHRVQVDVDHLRGHAADCAECVSSDGQSPERFVDTFRRRIRLSGNLDPDERRRLLRIAEQCPVHRTLSRQSKIETELVDDDPSPIEISAPADQAPDGSTRDE
jgi:putative redox protein